MFMVFRVSQCTPVTWQDFVPNGIEGCKDTSIQQACCMCHSPKAHPEQVLYQIRDTWGHKGLDLPLHQTLFDIFHMCKILCIKCCFSGYLTPHMSVMLSLADKMTRECPSKPEHGKWENQTLPPLQTEEKEEPKSFILVSTFAGVSGLQKFKENQFLIILQNMKTKPSNDQGHSWLPKFYSCSK